MSLKRRILTAVACALLPAVPLALICPATSAADTRLVESPIAAQTASLTPAEQQLLTSGSAIDVVMNPQTGDILSVTPASPASAAIARHSICNPGDGCYLTNRTPNADEGFYGGAGTIRGSWPYRSAYRSGKWTVSACWAGGCGVEVGPGSQVDLTSDVTGTSFTIY